jgi:hypothetical protein
VLNFLQKFHQHKNALLANAGLHIYIESSVPMEKVQPILTQILPLIGDNIKSLQLIGHHEDKLMCYIRLLYNNQSSGNNDEFSELMTKMLAQVRIISISTRFLSPIGFNKKLNSNSSSNLYRLYLLFTVFTIPWILTGVVVGCMLHEWMGGRGCSAYTYQVKMQWTL